MDATINIKGRRTSRHHGMRASLPSREAGVAPSAALHLPMANACGVAFDLFDVAEIFKKTPYVADLKPGGRYVAKDMLEIGGIAESAIRKVAGMSNLKFTQKFTKKFTWDGETIEIDAGVGGLDVKLTATELSKRKTKWQPRATEHTSAASWTDARQVGSAIDGAVAHRGRVLGKAHEKQCDADI